MRTKSEKLNLPELDYDILNEESQSVLKGGQKQVEEEVLDGGTLDEVVVTPN